VRVRPACGAPCFVPFLGAHFPHRLRALAVSVCLYRVIPLVLHVSQQRFRVICVHRHRPPAAGAETRGPEAFRAIVAGEYSTVGVPPAVQPLLAAMLSLDPAARPTAAQVWHAQGCPFDASLCLHETVGRAERLYTLLALSLSA
jgi:hypothetical protein